MDNKSECTSRGAGAPDTLYTMEELKDIVQELQANGWDYGTHPRTKAAIVLDKLQSIGALRVKEE